MRNSAAWMSLVLCLWSNIDHFTEAHDGQQTLYWCASLDCNDPISEGKTSLGYQAPDRDQLTFGRNQEVTILSKPVHSSKGHWIGRIRGKIGMIPVNFVKETKMYGKLENGYKFPLDLHPLQPQPKPVNAESHEVEVEPNSEAIEETPIQTADSESPVAVPNEISPTSANLFTSETVEEVLLQPSQAMGEKPTDDVQDSKSEETSHLLSSQPVTPVLTDNPSVVFTSEKTDLPLDEDSSSKSAATIDATPPVPASKESTESTEAPVINLHPSPSPFSEVYDSIQTFFGASDSDPKANEEAKENAEALAQSADSANPDHVNLNSVDQNRTDVHQGIQDPHNHEHGHVHHEKDDHGNPELHNHEHVSPVEVQTHDDSALNTPSEQNSEQDMPKVEEATAKVVSFDSQETVNVLKLNTPVEITPAEDEIPPLSAEPMSEEPTPKSEQLEQVHSQETSDPPPQPHSKEHSHENGDYQKDTTVVTPDAQVEDDEVKIEMRNEADVVAEQEESKPEPDTENVVSLVNTQADELVSIPNELPATESITDNLKTQAVQHEHPNENPLLAHHSHSPHHSHVHEGHAHSHDDHVHHHHSHAEAVKLTEDEVPSFAPEDPVQGPIDAQEESPAEQVDEAPKADLVGRHEHLNPLLHPYHHDHESEQGEQHHQHQKEAKSSAETSSFVLVCQYLSSTLINFLPEYLQDTIYDVNNALVFTGIIALTLVSICVPYFFIETFLSVRPLKKKVTELNKNLWKVSTAYENQQEEYDVFKKKALAYDEDKKRIEQLELELHLIKKLESKQKDQIRQFQKEIKASNKVAKEVESLVETTMDERNKSVEERDKLKSVVVSLQSSLKETTEELESAQADAATTQMDLDLITHTKENLDLKVKAVEKEMLELKQKVLSEVELRRSLQLDKDRLGEEKDSAQEELSDLKEILHKYEETVSDLNQELSLKENELSALKETLGDDSPLIDIAEMTARLRVADSQAKSLQSRVESITLENTSLNRNYEQTKRTVKTLQAEKDQAETRLQVLESYFKEKEEELRTIVEKYEVEKNIRGKDKDELVSMIEEKNDEVKDLSSRLDKLKEEFEQTKLAHRNEIRALEAKSHENWLSLCQSERKAQDVRKESELLRQKLTSIVKEKEAESNDARSSNGDVLAPFLFSQLELDEIPVPIMPDESSLPSYFGLGEGFYGLGDFEPPAPLDDDDEEDAEDTLNSIQRREREPHRPPPLGRISPTFSDNDSDMSPIVMPPRGGREDYSDGSSSPLHNRPTSRGHWVNGNGTQSLSTPTRRRGPQTSSPIQHGLNL